MELRVHVLEAKGLPLPTKGAAARGGTYVKVRVGKRKSRTERARGGGADPVWNEALVIRLSEVDREEEEEVSVKVYRDEEGLFGGRELIGRVRIPLSMALDDEGKSLEPAWFSLRRKRTEIGKVLLTISMCGKYGKCDSHSLPTGKRFHKHNVFLEDDGNSAGAPREIFNSPNVPTGAMSDGVISGSDEKQPMQSVASYLVQKLLNKNDISNKSDEGSSTISTNPDLSEISDTLTDTDSSSSEISSTFAFEEALEIMRSRDSREMPENLQGGILLDQTYNMAPEDMNKILFKPKSKFRVDQAVLQGTTEYVEGPWTWKCGNTTCLRRLITYITAASKLVKPIKAMEEQTYLMADGKEFAVLATVNTPDAPYGNCFHVNLLYKIMPGSELTDGLESSNLVISWNINFLQSTIMKGIIESGVRQGLKNSFEQFATLLSQNVEQIDPNDLPTGGKEQFPPLHQKHKSDWELAVEYFFNFTVISTVLMGLYLIFHILLSRSSICQGLEFGGFDLPDTLGELITSAIFFLQVKRILKLISRFVQARLRRGSYHSIKSQGNGWQLTVVLVEGINLPSEDSSASRDPFVVFTCNGITRTSSVQFQTLDPQWNEILEFDTMPEPPSIMDVKVYDYDGPFGLSPFLGHAEINLLGHSSSELSDMWVSLEGKVARALQSKLRLRVFLDNTKGIQAIDEYLSTVEKEAGKKLHVQPPHRNATFQRIFGLPPEEYLVNNFSCCLKRKILLQGRLFLSARVIGFYSNIFGYKTKFFFLWEDIEDIQAAPPSLATVGSPSLVITLRKDRRTDALHGAKSQDEDGRQKFHFQSFVSFNVVNRTTMALWRRKKQAIQKKLEIESSEHQEQQAIK